MYTYIIAVMAFRVIITAIETRFKWHIYSSVNSQMRMMKLLFEACGICIMFMHRLLYARILEPSDDVSMLAAGCAGQVT